MFTKCETCGSQVPPWHLRNWHYGSGKFRLGEEKRSRQVILQHCFEASQVLISVKLEPIDLVTYFSYLGCTFTYNNSNWVALYQSLWKAQQRWVMVGKVVLKTGGKVRARGMPSMAVLQLVLLYSSESRVVKGAMLKVLEVFHHRSARRIVGITALRTTSRE